MDVDLSTDLDALLPARRPARVGPQRRRHRHPAGAGVPRRARARSARRSRGRYNLLLKADPAQRLLRRPVRVQGRARRRRPRRCCRWSRTRAGSSTPSCWCWPSTTGCASTRCRSTGSTTRTPASTWCSTAKDDLQGIWRMLRTASDGPSAPLTAAPWAGERRGPAPTWPGSSSRFASIGVVSTIVFAAAVRRARRTARAVARRRRRAGACCRSPTPRPTAGSPSPCAAGPVGDVSRARRPGASPPCRWRSPSPR